MPLPFSLALSEDPEEAGEELATAAVELLAAKAALDPLKVVTDGLIARGSAPGDDELGGMAGVQGVAGRPAKAAIC